MRFLLFVLFAFQVTAFAAPQAPGLTQVAAVNLTSAGTAQVISATNVYCQCAIINALAANTGVIYIGDSAVAAANGFPLQKGDTMTLCSSNGQNKINLKTLYIDGGTTNDDIKVSCSYFADVKITPKPL